MEKMNGDAEEDAVSLLERLRDMDKFGTAQDVRVEEAEACRTAANRIMNATNAPTRRHDVSDAEKSKSKSKASSPPDACCAVDAPIVRAGDDAGDRAGTDERSQLLLALRVYSLGVSLVNTAQWEGEGQPRAVGEGAEQFGDEKRALFEEARRQNAELRRTLLPLYCNRSLCYLRLGDAAEARRDAQEAVRIETAWRQAEEATAAWKMVISLSTTLSKKQKEKKRREETRKWKDKRKEK